MRPIAIFTSKPTEAPTATELTDELVAAEQEFAAVKERVSDDAQERASTVRTRISALEAESRQLDDLIVRASV